jgi:hypothetical protein
MVPTAQLLRSCQAAGNAIIRQAIRARSRPGEAMVYSAADESSATTSSKINKSPTRIGTTVVTRFFRYLSAGAKRGRFGQTGIITVLGAIAGEFATEHNTISATPLWAEHIVGFQVVSDCVSRDR